MGWRIVTVSSRAKLELKMNYLVVRGDTVIKRVFLDEISLLVIENTGCSLTASLLEALWKKKVIVIFCDSHRNPGAQLLPFTARFESNSQLYNQIEWLDEIKAMVWAEIVRMKIRKQAENLKSVDSDLAEKVYSYSFDVVDGDKTNREGHAAKVYFNALFHSGFSRDVECFENAALNYGYAVLLSCVNRIIVTYGYSTQLGIFHKSTFNQFNLGCDLMEPFRPIFDSIAKEIPIGETLSQEHKYRIINTLNNQMKIDGQETTLLNGIQIYIKSVLSALDAREPLLIKDFKYEF